MLIFRVANRRIVRLINVALFCGLGHAAAARADIVVDFSEDAGGEVAGPLSGLAARATFDVAGTHLSVLLENTSTGVPRGFDVSDSLLVSLGMNLPGADMLNGNAAVIGPGSLGLGSWSKRVAGDSVGEQWLWTNDYGGDLLESFRNVISTSEGEGGGKTHRFDGGTGTVGGPFGGIAAKPPLIGIPKKQSAVSNSIRFDLTLNHGLTEKQLQSAAEHAIVEFGSDARYLQVPEPPSAAIAGVGVLLLRRRRL